MLIVDDNAINVDLVTFVLEAAGMQVDSAASAGLALGCMGASAPDLILMDIQMPGMDGMALTRLLKADPVTSHIVIVAFTAYAMKGDEEKMRNAGCDGYLSKPIDVGNFAASVSACLAAGAVRGKAAAA